MQFQVELRDDDIVLLVLDFLRGRGFARTLCTLEEESGVCSDDCTTEVRVRQRVPLARVPAHTPAFARFPPLSS